MKHIFSGYAWCAGVVALVLSGQAQAQQVIVKDAWIRGTVQGQSVTGAFMELRGTATVRLVGVASPVAKSAEVHNMTMENGVMKMFPVAALDVPAGKTVRLAPGGYHVMLTGLQKPLAAGERVPLRLAFESADKSRHVVELLVEVRDIQGNPAHGGPSQGNKHHGH